jgi:hypothetical protein
MRKKQEKILFAIFILFCFLAIKDIKADPTGATMTPGNSSRGSNPNVQTANAQAGNVTQLNIDQTRITDIWQGFFGNVSGRIVLQNSGGNSFYDWSSSQVTGEVYATRNTISSWSNINCTNSTQWQIEESSLSIANTSTDGINETFNATSHPAFMVGNNALLGCRSTRPYNSTGQAGQFWNVLLNSDITNVVYASILADNSNAFDNTTVDFELLVPTNRTTSTAVYYFYAELN